MKNIALIFCNQILFTGLAVFATAHLKSPEPFGVLLGQSWIVLYVLWRAGTLLLQLRVFQTNCLLKSLSFLVIFNLILTLSSAYFILGEPLTSKDMASFILTLLAIGLLAK